MNQKPKALDFAGNKAWARAAWEASEWDDVAAYIGSKAEQYRTTWEKMQGKMAGGNGSAAVLGFHWTALFFGFAWFFSRKMWAIGVLMLAVPLLLGSVLNSNGGVIGVSIAGAIIAKSLYVQQAVARVAEIKGAGGGREQIAAAGGISKVGLAIGGTIFALAFVGFYVAMRAAVR